MWSHRRIDEWRNPAPTRSVWCWGRIPAMNLSLVLPCFNEAQNIRDVSASALACDFISEIILVDDGSRDGTGRVIDELASEDARIRAIHHPENRGYGAAIQSGVDVAEGEVVAWMDSDGQFHPEDLLLLLEKIGDAPFIAATRRKRADHLHRLLLGKCYGALIACFLGVHVRDLNCGMRLFKKALWEKIRPTKSSGALINAEVFLRLKRQGIPWVHVPVPHYPRLHGSPTGGSPRVILRMFRELWHLRNCIDDAVAKTVRSGDS